MYLWVGCVGVALEGDGCGVYLGEGEAGRVAMKGIVWYWRWYWDGWVVLIMVVGRGNGFGDAARGKINS